MRRRALVSIVSLVPLVITVLAVPIGALAGGLEADHTFGHGRGHRGSGKSVSSPAGCFSPAAGSRVSGSMLAGSLLGSAVDSVLLTRTIRLNRGGAGGSDPVGALLSLGMIDAWRQVSDRAFARSGLGVQPRIGEPLPFLLSAQGEHTPGLWFLGGSGGVVGMSANLAHPHVSPAQLMDPETAGSPTAGR